MVVTSVYGIKRKHNNIDILNEVIKYLTNIKESIIQTDINIEKITDSDVRYIRDLNKEFKNALNILKRHNERTLKKINKMVGKTIETEQYWRSYFRL